MIHPFISGSISYSLFQMTDCDSKHRAANIYIWLCVSPWTAGNTVRLMASTSPSGQPNRKQSDTSKSNRPGFNTRLLPPPPPRTSAPSFTKLGNKRPHEYRSVISTGVECNPLTLLVWLVNVCRNLFLIDEIKDESSVQESKCRGKCWELRLY